MGPNQTVTPGPDQTVTATQASEPTDPEIQKSQQSGDLETGSGATLQRLIPSTQCKPMPDRWGPIARDVRPETEGSVAQAAVSRPVLARFEELAFVLVLDNGPIHTSKASQAALAARPWLTVEWLPKYAPELNDIERAWRDLKRHFLAHQTFTDTDHLDRAIHNAVNDMNVERQPLPCTNLRIAA